MDRNKVKHNEETKSYKMKEQDKTSGKKTLKLGSALRSDYCNYQLCVTDLIYSCYFTYLSDMYFMLNTFNYEILNYIKM